MLSCIMNQSATDLSRQVVINQRGVELASSSPISVPSVSGDRSHSVTTVRLPTNGQGLDQTQDSTGSTF